MYAKALSCMMPPLWACVFYLGAQCRATGRRPTESDNLVWLVTFRQIPGKVKYSLSLSLALSLRGTRAAHPASGASTADPGHPRLERVPWAACRPSLSPTRMLHTLIAFFTHHCVISACPRLPASQGPSRRRAGLSGRVRFHQGLERRRPHGRQGGAAANRPLSVGLAGAGRPWAPRRLWR